MNRSDLLVGRWGVRFCGRRFPASIGRGGISANKAEGDGATPAGAHRISAVLYRAGRIGRAELPSGGRRIGPQDFWSDDPRDPAYNRPVRAPHRFGHERLFRADPIYDLILITDWNTRPAVPGSGSAIFLHQWRGPGHLTAGCVAFRRDHLIWIARRLRPWTRVLVG